MRTKRILFLSIITFVLTLAFSGCVIIADTNTGSILVKNRSCNHLYITDIHVMEEHDENWRHVYEIKNPIYGLEYGESWYVSLRPGLYKVSVTVYDYHTHGYIDHTFETQYPRRIETGDYVDVIFNGYELYFK